VNGNLAANLAALSADAPALLSDTLALGMSALVATGSGGEIFTDDRAPVETLVDSLVLNFLLGGGAEQLQSSP
jgi:hypothetical protein